jgi:hypothetical protein
VRVGRSWERGRYRGCRSQRAKNTKGIPGRRSKGILASPKNRRTNGTCYIISPKLPGSLVEELPHVSVLTAVLPSPAPPIIAAPAEHEYQDDNHNNERRCVHCLPLLSSPPHLRRDSFTYLDGTVHQTGPEEIDIRDLWAEMPFFCLHINAL